jgi:hypothetical protein
VTYKSTQLYTSSRYGYGKYVKGSYTLAVLFAYYGKVGHWLYDEKGRTLDLNASQWNLPALKGL